MTLPPAELPPRSHATARPGVDRSLLNMNDWLLCRMVGELEAAGAAQGANQAPRRLSLLQLVYLFRLPAPLYPPQQKTNAGLSDASIFLLRAVPTSLSSATASHLLNSTPTSPPSGASSRLTSSA